MAGFRTKSWNLNIFSTRDKRRKREIETVKKCTGRILKNVYTYRRLEANKRKDWGWMQKTKHDKKGYWLKEKEKEEFRERIRKRIDTKRRIRLK